MARRADIVVGANFGDEGKGLVTDFLSAEAGPDTLVVRHNGGAQAAHTVTTPDGRRHVFRHFGSGTLAGASTFLSRFYACNPIFFFKELVLLQDMNIKPVVWVDRDSPITTPYDMMINQIAEESRGSGRHGSCGAGFGETIERSLQKSFRLSYADLANNAQLKAKLVDIRREWLPGRLEALKIGAVTEAWRKRIESDEILERYIQDVEEFLHFTNPAPGNFLKKAETMIFEGAQGLLLDQENGWFPHVTRSHTGIKNALALAGEAGIENTNVTYVTRAYNTRHGAGPLPHELPEKPYERIKDETNIFNDYQGSLRFAWLDLDLLALAIERDLRGASGISGHRLVVTCVDQVEQTHTFFCEGNRRSASIDAFLEQVRQVTKIPGLLTSRGPSRETISLTPP